MSNPKPSVLARLVIVFNMIYTLASAVVFGYRYIPTAPLGYAYVVPLRVQRVFFPCKHQ